MSCSESDEKKIGEQNLKKIEQVEIGMDTVEVLKIMGEPIERRKYKCDLFYDYDLPSNVSGQITIIFDSTHKVIDKGNIPH